jgi:hypothetical protein
LSFEVCEAIDVHFKNNGRANVYAAEQLGSSVVYLPSTTHKGMRSYIPDFLNSLRPRRLSSDALVPRTDDYKNKFHGSDKHDEALHTIRGALLYNYRKQNVLESHSRPSHDIHVQFV